MPIINVFFTIGFCLIRCRSIYLERIYTIPFDLQVGIGKDHTIYALQPGYVRFYTDPAHPKRRFVGVVLYQEDSLPYSPDEPRRRRFDLVDLVAWEADRAMEIKEARMREAKAGEA